MKALEVYREELFKAGKIGIYPIDVCAYNKTLAEEETLHERRVCDDLST